MKNKILNITSLLSVFFVAFGSPLKAETKNDPEKAKKILEQANHALERATDIEYSYTYNGTGKLNGKFTGRVKLIQKEDYLTSWIWTELNFHSTNSNGNSDIQNTWFISIKDGGIQLFDKNENSLKSGTMHGGSMNLMTYAYYSVLFQYIQSNPFASSIKNESIDYIGENEIGGVECEIIKVKNQFGDWVYWYIGKDDHLIYAQKTENTSEKGEGMFFFQITDLQINKKLTEADFMIPTNNSTKRIDEDKKVIAPGHPAPGWQIEGKDGGVISSNQLKGKVVLLDFWASWCNPCWKIMPIVNELAREYKDMYVLGINVWENPKKNVYKYMKNEYLNYQTVMDEDARLALNFKVAYLPVLVLIDKEGVIRHVSKGYSDELKQQLSKVINESL